MALDNVLDDDVSYPGGGGGSTPGTQTSTEPIADGFNEMAEGDGGVLALAYGRHICIGHLVYFDHQEGPPPVLIAAYMQGEGPWEACEKGWYAGEELVQRARTEAVLPGFHFHPGTQSSSVSDSVQGVDTYTPDSITYNKTAVTVVKLPEKYSSEQRPDKFRGRYKCLKVVDAQGAGLGYSANPARVAVDALKRGGYDIINRIDWDSWSAWKGFCDGILSWNDGTNTHSIPRFEANPAFTTSVDLPTVLDVCCLVSCTRWQDDGSKIRFLLPTDTTPIHTFTANNIVMGRVRAVPADVQSVPRHILTKFLDTLDEYFREASVELRRDTLIDAYGDLVSTRALPNMNHSQAQRITAYQMRLETDFRLFVELTGAGDSMHLLPGDFCTISLGNIYLDGDYMVTDVTDVSPESAPDERNFRLQKITGSLYSDDDHYPIQRHPDTEEEE